MKRFFSIFCLVSVVVLFLSAVNMATAEVFINSFPEDVTVNEGDPLDIPVFFGGGSLTGKPIELLIWKETIDSSEKEYLGSAGWIPFTDTASKQPFIYLESMIEYANLMWRVFESTADMTSFTLNICIRDVGTGSESCGQRKINIIPSDEPPPACAGLSVTPTSISKSLKRGTSATIQIAVKDSCGTGIDFNASSSEGWIGLTKQTGLLTVTLNSSSLSVGTHYGSIDISANKTSSKVNVTLSVTAPTFDFPVCTPSSVSIWPVTITAASGETATKSVAITDNCGHSLSYTATESVTWLTAQTSGTGSMQLTVNTAGMTAGTYTGQVQISPAGYSPVTLTVTLTITGICEPASAVITPTSISKTVTAGMNAADAVVTIKDNCGGSLAYTVTGVSGAWITAPLVNAQGTGTLTVKFNTAGLSVGTYTGSITLNVGTYGTKSIPVTVNVSSVSTDVVLLKNFTIQYFSYAPGQVRYFYFHENSNRNLGNKNPLFFEQMDMNQGNGLGDIDMLIKYAGVNCELGKPTMADYTAAKAGTIKSGQNNLYFSLASTAFEYPTIHAPNPEGCYYVMVLNASSITEDKISIKYWDFDSY